MRILVLNCGSSSVKYQLFELDGEKEVVLANGIVEEVGLGNPSLTHRRPGRERLTRRDLPVREHRDAIRIVLEVLVDPSTGPCPTCVCSMRWVTALSTAVSGFQRRSR